MYYFPQSTERSLRMNIENNWRKFLQLCDNSIVLSTDYSVKKRFQKLFI